MTSPSPQAKGDSKQTTNSKELNQVKDSVCQFQNIVTKKMQSLSEQSKSLKHQIKLTSDVHERVSSEITSLEECNRETLSCITRMVGNNMKSMTENIKTIQESVA